MRILLILSILTIFLLLYTGNVLLSDRDDIIDKQAENIYNLSLDNSGLEGKVIALKIMLLSHIINREQIVDLTAYTARKEETDNSPHLTAILQKPVPGWTIAVSQDLKYLLGKRVYIEGFGVRYVNDLMNKRYTKRVDVLTGSVKKAKEIGLQKNIKLILIEPEKAIKELIGEF